ncbi:hypothetical protein VTN77DRAFT_2580 [Rasamsonia byssochlamydoides]|uniref:uncharacterized protein n=1 Tax=Rasamsonia byssochlamydoides TaxID=89139 RepID=UPI003742D1FA
MASTKPTVLFVHGSWHNPKHFQRMRDFFEANGFPTSCPQQPSVGQLPPIGLMEDAETIRDELKKLVETEQKGVLVMAHSYGGVVTAQAVDREFAKKDREAKGLAGGVIHLVYMCAFMLPLGDSLGSAFGGGLPPLIPIDEEQDPWVSELKPGPAIAQLTPIIQASYLYHPVTYLFCENDEALPLAVQQMMVQKAEEKGVTIRKETCTAGHSPFLSQPETVLNVAKKVVAA